MPKKVTMDSIALKLGISKKYSFIGFTRYAGK